MFGFGKKKSHRPSVIPVQLAAELNLAQQYSGYGFVSTFQGSLCYLRRYFSTPWLHWAAGLSCFKSELICKLLKSPITAVIIH